MDSIYAGYDVYAHYVVYFDYCEYSDLDRAFEYPHPTNPDVLDYASHLASDLTFDVGNGLEFEHGSDRFSGWQRIRYPEPRIVAGDGARIHSHSRGSAAIRSAAKRSLAQFDGFHW